MSEMANRKPECILQTLQLHEIADLNFVKCLPRFAFPESKLCPQNGYTFDGMHRVDVTLWIREDLAVACELKLGCTGLNKANIDGKLKSCRLVQGNTRVAGSMMAILDQNFDFADPPTSLSVQLDDKTVPLCRDWFVVAHKQILDRWKGNSRPAFSCHAKCVSISAIVEAFGGREEFNDLVREQLTFDYFSEWIAACE